MFSVRLINRSQFTLYIRRTIPDGLPLGQIFDSTPALRRHSALGFKRVSNPEIVIHECEEVVL